MTMATVATAVAAALSALVAFRQERAAFETNLCSKQVDVFATYAEQFGRAELVIGRLRPLIIQFNSTQDPHIPSQFQTLLEQSWIATNDLRNTTERIKLIAPDKYWVAAITLANEVQGQIETYQDAFRSIGREQASGDHLEGT
jgi:hypothetical protein